MKKTLWSAFAVCAMAGGFVLAGATSAAAAEPAAGPEPAMQQDGTDPVATGCADSAITAQSANIRDSGGTVVGWIQLRYSQQCATAWAKVIKGAESVPCQQGDVGCAFATVHRDSDGLEFECQTPSSDAPEGECWTAQVNDDGVTSHAVGSVDLGSEWPEARTASY